MMSQSSLGALTRRALALVVTAKLGAVQAQITTLEDDFLAHTVVPDGSAVGQRAAAQVADGYLRRSGWRSCCRPA
jgi:hypothetical protein